MRNHANFIWTFAISMVILTYVQDVQACSARVAVAGKSFSTRIGGAVFGSIAGPSFPREKDNYFDYEITLRGKHNYKFNYTGNIEKIRLWMGREKVYEGSPIDSFNGSRGPLRIDIKSDGNFSVEIKDECTVSSFISSLF